MLRFFCSHLRRSPFPVQLILMRTRSMIQLAVFVCFLYRAAVSSSAITLGVVEEAGRLGIKRVWLQPGSESDEVNLEGWVG